MTMNYKFGKKKDNKKAIMLFIAVLVISIIFLRKPIFSIFNKGSILAAEPIWGVGHFISGEITEGFLSLQSKKTLIKRLLDLQEEFVSMASLKKERDVLAEENVQLEKTLGLYKEFGFEKTARVLSRPPKTSYDTLVIDRGQVDGVEEGDLIFSGENIFLGIVRESGSRSSLVELLSTSTIETEVRFPISDLALTLVGRGGGAFSVNVPRDIPIQEGEFIVSTLNDSFVIGEVSRVTGDPQDPSKTVIAKSPINMNYLNYVFIKRI